MPVVIDIANTPVQIKAAGTTITDTVNVSIGEIIVVMLAYDPSGASVPTITMSDTDSNSYTAIDTLIPAPATTSAGVGVITQAFYATASQTDAALTITATFSASITSKTMGVMVLQQTLQAQTNTRTSAIGTNTGFNTLTTPSGNSGDIVIAFIGMEQTNPTFTGASDTTNGTWSSVIKNGTSGGNTATNISLAYQYKILTGSGTQAARLTSTASSNWSGQSFVIAAAPLYPASGSGAISLESNTPNTELKYPISGSGSILLTAGNPNTTLIFPRAATASILLTAFANSIVEIYGSTASILLTSNTPSTVLKFQNSGTASILLTASNIARTLAFPIAATGSILLTAGTPGTTLKFPRTATGSISLTASNIARTLEFQRTGSGSISIAAGATTVTLRDLFIGWGIPIK